MRRLRRHIAVGLVFSLALSAMSLLVTQSAFVLRRAFIAQHLCENRFVPDSPCEGMCYLKKHLQEHEEDQHDEQAVVRSSVVAVWTLPYDSVSVEAPRCVRRTSSRFAEADTGTVLGADIFRPPRQGRG